MRVDRLWYRIRAHNRSRFPFLKWVRFSDQLVGFACASYHRKGGTGRRPRRLRAVCLSAYVVVWSGVHLSSGGLSAAGSLLAARWRANGPPSRPRAGRGMNDNTPTRAALQVTACSPPFRRTINVPASGPVFCASNYGVTRCLRC